MKKLQFDAIKHFPWDDDDDTIAIMGLSRGIKISGRSYGDGYESMSKLI
jgi:hypothetical protein